MPMPALTMTIDSISQTDGGPLCGEPEWIAGMEDLVAGEPMALDWYTTDQRCLEDDQSLTCVGDISYGTGVWAGVLWGCANVGDACDPAWTPPVRQFSSVWRYDAPDCTELDCYIGINELWGYILVLDIRPQGVSLPDCLVVDVDYRYVLDGEMRNCVDVGRCGGSPTNTFDWGASLDRTVTGIGPYATKDKYAWAIFEAAKGTFNLDDASATNPWPTVTVA